MDRRGLGGAVGLGALLLLLGCESREVEPPAMRAQEVATPTGLEHPGLSDNPLELMSGRVLEVGPDRLLVRGPTGEAHALHLTEETRFLEPGGDVAPERPRPGALVQASFHLEEGVLVADEVLLVSSSLTAPEFEREAR